MQVQSAAEQASPVKSVGIQQLRSGRPDSALVKQLQAQLSGLAAQLEAVTEQLAAASQAAIDEQRKAQVCFGLTLDYDQHVCKVHIQERLLSIKCLIAGCQTATW